MATVIIRDSLTDDQARVIGGVLQTSGSGGGGGGSTDLISVGGDPVALGQATSANSLPIVIASNQSPVPVTFSEPSATPRSIYGSQSAVVIGVETPIVTYTAPSSPTQAYLQFINCAGQNVAQWIVDNDGTVFDQAYTTAAQLHTQFDFKTGLSNAPGYLITAASTITVSIIQIGPDAANFNARIQVMELG